MTNGAVGDSKEKRICCFMGSSRAQDTVLQDIPANIRLRTYVLTAMPGFKGFGIELDENCFIIRIRADSPAERSGLQVYQKIVVVNRKNLYGACFKTVAREMRKNKKFFEVCVIDVTADLWSGRLRYLEETKQKNLVKASSFPSKPVKKTRGDCAICLDALDDETLVAACGHMYCMKCLEVYGATDEFNCPTCRKAISHRACIKVFFN